MCADFWLICLLSGWLNAESPAMSNKVTLGWYQRKCFDFRLPTSKLLLTMDSQKPESISLLSTKGSCWYYSGQPMGLWLPLFFSSPFENSELTVRLKFREHRGPK